MKTLGVLTVNNALVSTACRAKENTARSRTVYRRLLLSFTVTASSSERDTASFLQEGCNTALSVSPVPYKHLGRVDIDL